MSLELKTVVFVTITLLISIEDSKSFGAVLMLTSLDELKK